MELFYSITNIALLSGFIFAIFITILLRKQKNRAKPYMIISMTACIAGIVFLLLFKFNDYNDTYLSKYMNYTTIEPIEKSSSEVWGDNYEFFLVYDDGSKIRVSITFEDVKPYNSAGEIHIFLKDYYGDILWSKWGKVSNNDIEFYKKTFGLYDKKWNKLKE